MHPAATTTVLARHSQWHSLNGSSSPPTVNPVTRFSPHTPVTGDRVKTRTFSVACRRAASSLARCHSGFPSNSLTRHASCPPMHGRRSKTHTRSPRSAAASAASIPAVPPPTTATSTFR